MTPPPPDPRIIPGLEPGPRQEDRENYDLIVNTPDEAGAREVAALRVGATRAAIEWCKRLVDDCSSDRLSDAVADHDAAVEERRHP